jgi:hypothetical protein
MPDNVGERSSAWLLPHPDPDNDVRAPAFLAGPHEQSAAFSFALSFGITGVHSMVATLPALPEMLHPISKLVVQLSGWKPIRLLISNRQIYKKAFCLEHS